MNVLARSQRRVSGIFAFFKGKNKEARKTALKQLRSLVAFLRGNHGPDEDGVFNLDAPPLPNCPKCGSKVDLLPGHTSCGSGAHKDSRHYARCRGVESHHYTIRLLPAYKKTLLN